jgi:hypothetical protein
MSTENVSWNKPFGDSSAASLVGGSGGLSSVFNNVSMTDPIGTNSFLADATGHGLKDAPLNPDGTSKETGEQVVVNQGTDYATGSPAPQGDAFGNWSLVKPVISGPQASPITVAPKPLRSAIALEERLRSEARKAKPKNIEFGYNLESKPTSPVRGI